MKKEKAGLYVHIPFCISKCSYCDFYSKTTLSSELFDAYLSALLREAEREEYSGISCDTLYLGGGTPSLLGGERIARLCDALGRRFGNFSEATMEANPADNLEEIFKLAKSGGINRVSLGVQSGVEEELKILSRRHNNEQVLRAVEACHNAGIDNLSLDLMLGIPLQTKESLKGSIDFLSSLAPRHISAYMLSLEEGTPLYKNRDSFTFPSEEGYCELYSYAGKELDKRGYKKYEISNFCKEGYESQHNLKYWRSCEYIGLGAGAHGRIGERGYCYPPSIENFISAPKREDLGITYSPEMFAALRLRLSDGLSFSDFEAAFFPLPQSFFEVAKRLEKGGFCSLSEDRLSLSEKGFLLSNKIISDLVCEIE